MVSKSIDETLTEITKAYADSRTQVCQLEAGLLINNTCSLSGNLLDKETLTAVTQSISSHFPQITFATTDVHILRQSPPGLAAVNTNLAGLHKRPSRSSEMVSQCVNGMFVELLLREEGDWVFVRQMDGYLGWLLRLYLTTELPQVTPTHLVSAPQMLLYAEPGRQDKLVGRVFAGTAVHITNKVDDWVQIEMVGGQCGWGTAVDISPFANLAQDASQRREQMIDYAHLFIGVPYRWGGSAVDGIDCSGFVQLLHRLVGITLPRDADMQYTAGITVDQPLQPGDLLYFGGNHGHRSISHVAMSLGGWQIIHSSGSRNGVYIDEMQEGSWLREHFVGANTFVEAGI